MTTFVGNIAKAAETRTVNVAGVQTLVTDFNIAENYRGRDGSNHTQFYRISLWRDKGAKLAQYLTLGRPLQVSGRVKARAYIDKNGVAQCQLEMANPQITFITGKPNEVEAVTDAPADLPFIEEEE